MIEFIKDGILNKLSLKVTFLSYSIPGCVRMERPNENKIKHYRGIAVYEKEAQALEALEKILKEPIPLIKEFTDEIIGFSVEDYHIIEINLFPLSDLPERIGSLINLQVLDLTGNQLSSVPESLGNLTNLQSR